MHPTLRSRYRVDVPLQPTAPLSYDRLGDAVLVQRAKDGDAVALDALCARHAPRVARLSAHVLADPEDARDAAQDVLAKLCGKIDQFRGDAAFSTWLHRLTLNACRDVVVRRRRRRYDVLDDDRCVSAVPAPELEAERAELRAELRQGLAGLPLAQARVLVLKDALGFSFEEISLAWGMPVGTAKCYAHRGRAAMRELLATGSSA